MSKKINQFKNKYLGVFLDIETNEKFIAVQIEANQVYLRNMTNTGKDVFMSYNTYMNLEKDSVSRFRKSE